MKQFIYNKDEVKIYKRYSPVGFFLVLFSLCLVALPVISLFMPISRLFISNTEGIMSKAADLKGLDLFQSLIMSNNPISLEITKISELGYFATGTPVVYLIISILYVIALLFAAILALKCLILLFGGQSRNPKSFASLAWVTGITYILFYGSIFATTFICKYISDQKGIAIAIGTEIFVLVFLGLALLIPIIIFIYSAVTFKRGYYANYVEFIGEDEGAKVVEIEKKITTIPSTVKSIGGHVFSNNQNLEIADIPEDVTSIGPGAFANCGKLKTVIIPIYIKSIGYNAFFNCVGLKNITYLGTKKDWSKVTRGSNWLVKAGTDIVRCKDGAVRVDPTK